VRLGTLVNRRGLVRLLIAAWIIPVALGLALAGRSMAQSLALARQEPRLGAGVAAVPIARFAHACAGHVAATDQVVLLDAGYGYGVLTMDGYDDWNAAEFVYNVLPAHVLVAPDVARAQSLLRTAHPRYLAIWLQAGKRETASLHLPEYAAALQASDAFQLVLRYTDPGGDVGLLFAVR
jgi:hypothetical protein